MPQDFFFVKSTVIDTVYFKQAELLLWIIPLIDREAVFTLKGGTVS